MRIQAIVATALLLGACAKEYTFTPPDSPEGRACVARCQASQSSCRRSQDQRADRAAQQCEDEAARRETQCEIEANIEYLACLKYAKTNEDRAACEKEDCTPASCAQSPSYSLCDSDYRTCFQSCGGKIGVLD